MESRYIDMFRNLLISLLSALLLLSGCAGTGNSSEKKLGSATLYPQPDGLADNVKGCLHHVSVNGEPCAVYRTEAVGGGREYGQVYPEYVYFDYNKEGRLHIEVKADYPVSRAEILPSRYGVEADLSENVISFDVTHPGQYFVKTNGDVTNGNTSDNNLYLFINPPEKDIPSQDDPNVVWFGPGVHAHKEYELESGKTYYIAGGAFVYGRFYGSSVENVTIRGRGVICGENLTSMGDSGRIICITHQSRNLTIEGVNCMDPKVWTVALYHCQDVHVDNIHTISHGQSSDGIDITSCKNVLVENSFFRGHDDMLAVKARDFQNIESNPWSCESVTFRKNVIWCDSSNPMTIGYETNQPIRNILYESIDILNMSRPPVWRMEAIMAIEPHPDVNNGTIGGSVEGVIYRDIRVDLKVPQNSLFRFSVDGGGAIRNVLVQDVFVNYGGTLGGKIFGRSDARVENVSLRNIRNDNETLAQERVCRNEFTDNLKIEPAGKYEIHPGEKWEFSNEYSGYSTVQGGNNWYYKYFTDGIYLNMDWNEDRDMWAMAQFCFIAYRRSDDPAFGEEYTHFRKMAASMHPDSRPAALVWKAPASGKFKISLKARRHEKGGDGVIVKVLKNELTKICSHDLSPSFNTFFNFPEMTVRLKKGDRVSFVVDPKSNSVCDMTQCVPVIEYVSEN